jgi:hypothetical protein
MLVFILLHISLLSIFIQKMCKSIIEFVQPTYKFHIFNDQFNEITKKRWTRDVRVEE